ASFKGLQKQWLETKPQARVVGSVGGGRAPASHPTGSASVFRFINQKSRDVEKLLWFTPTKRRKVMHAHPHAHEHLNFVRIGGNYGRTSDLELDVYFTDNAAALEKNRDRPYVSGLFGGFN
ncbi:hypothetical protein Tco_0540606, partial [Tanacetum coccineum]